jgi:NAD(P)-dependent dehydrogenase (short-subunit alcohol dehydrogenase family)
MAIQFDSTHWALVLGGSSGFGLATAQKLAGHGMNVVVVHRDRRGAMAGIEPQFEKIRQCGVGFAAFNVDALAEEGRKRVLDELAAKLGTGGRIRLVMHSIAYGNLKLLAPTHPEYGSMSRQAREELAAQLGVAEQALSSAVDAVLAGSKAGPAVAALASPPAYDRDALLEEEDFARTVYSMGTSLASWVRDLFSRGMFAPSARVVGMTSEGNEVAWRGYAAVSAAKAALEAVSRSIALELGPYGITSNIVQAGVTDTPALRLIPGSDRLKADALLRNPMGRLTAPIDVANFICLLCTDEAAWVNGTIVRVDGGEHVCG